LKGENKKVNAFLATMRIIKPINYLNSVLGKFCSGSKWIALVLHCSSQRYWHVLLFHVWSSRVSADRLNFDSQRAGSVIEVFCLEVKTGSHRRFQGSRTQRPQTVKCRHEAASFPGLSIGLPVPFA
jgi:hypothetical protein